MENHGYNTLEWCGDVLINRTFGPFNITGVTAAFEHIKTTALTSGKPRWYRVDVLDGETLGSPDVMKVISQSYYWCLNEGGCEAIISCCANVVQEKMLQQFIDHSKLNMKVMANLEEAHKYISGLK